MKPEQKKAAIGMSAVAAVSVAFFVFGCGTTDLWFSLGAILLLAGKELEEFRRLKQGDTNDNGKN